MLLAAVTSFWCAAFGILLARHLRLHARSVEQLDELRHAHRREVDLALQLDAARIRQGALEMACETLREEALRSGRGPRPTLLMSRGGRA